MTDLLTLNEFLFRLIEAADGVYERRWDLGTKTAGGGNGPGPHWGVRGDDWMLSPSLEELLALFCVSRVLRPRTIVELGTGTGLSATALACGWPHAAVVTSDNFGRVDCGLEAQAVWRWVKVFEQVTLVRGDWAGIASSARDVDLVFRDGSNTYPEIKGATSRLVTLTHDFAGYCGPVEHGWFLDTSSVVGVDAADPEMAGLAVTAASLVVPDARIAKVGTPARFKVTVEPAE